MHTPTEIGQRIASMRLARKLSQTALANQIKLITGETLTSQAVNQWESGATKTMKPANLLACADVLAVSVRWLVTGIPGKRSELSAEAAELVKLFHPMSIAEKRAVLDAARRLARERPPDVKANDQLVRA